MSSDGSTYIYALIGGVSFLVSAIKNHRTYRHIENHPTSKASSAAQGLCELQGFAWPKKEGFRHYDGNELIYYGLQVQKYVTRGSGKNKRSYWETRFSRVIQSPFYLADATGLVEVIMEDLSSYQRNEDQSHFLSKFFKLFRLQAVKINDDFCGHPKIRNWKSISAAEQEYLLSQVIVNPPADFPPKIGLLGFVSGSYRIVEHMVPVGSPLYANGYFSTLSHQNEKEKLIGYTDFAKHVFDKEARSLKKMDHLLDANRDGKINEREIRNGYATFAARIRQSALQKSRPELEIENQIFGRMSSSQSTPMILHSLHQEQIVAKLKKKFYSSFALGVILLTFVIGDVSRRVYPILQQRSLAEEQRRDEAIQEERRAAAFKMKAIEEARRSQLAQSEDLSRENGIDLGRQKKSTFSQVSAHEEKLKQEDVTKLHLDCVNRQIEASCRKLLDQAGQIRLPANYQNYYKRILCKLGKEPNCQN